MNDKLLQEQKAHKKEEEVDLHVTMTNKGILKDKEDQIVKLTRDVQLAEQQQDEMAEEVDQATRKYERLQFDFKRLRLVLSEPKILGPMKRKSCPLFPLHHQYLPLHQWQLQVLARELTNETYHQSLAKSGRTFIIPTHVPSFMASKPIYKGTMKKPSHQSPPVVEQDWEQDRN